MNTEINGEPSEESPYEIIINQKNQKILLVYANGTKKKFKSLEIAVNNEQNDMDRMKARKWNKSKCMDQKIQFKIKVSIKIQ